MASVWPSSRSAKGAGGGPPRLSTRAGNEPGKRGGRLLAAPIRRAALAQLLQGDFLHRLGQSAGGSQDVVHLANEGVDGGPVKLTEPLGHGLQPSGVLGNHWRHQSLGTLEHFAEAVELVEDVEEGFSFHSGVRPWEAVAGAVQSCSPSA